MDRKGNYSGHISKLESMWPAKKEANRKRQLVYRLRTPAETSPVEDSTSRGNGERLNNSAVKCRSMDD